MAFVCCFICCCAENKRHSSHHHQRYFSSPPSQKPQQQFHPSLSDPTTTQYRNTYHKQIKMLPHPYTSSSAFLNPLSSSSFLPSLHHSCPPSSSSSSARYHRTTTSMTLSPFSLSSTPLSTYTPPSFSTLLTTAASNNNLPVFEPRLDVGALFSLIIFTGIVVVFWGRVATAITDREKRYCYIICI